MYILLIESLYVVPLFPFSREQAVYFAPCLAPVSQLLFCIATIYGIFNEPKNLTSLTKDRTVSYPEMI